MGLEYNQNVLLTQKNEEDDFILLPQLGIRGHWPLSFRNSLDLSLAAGYRDYLSHNDLSSFTIAPGSGLSFDLYVGDWKINFNDAASISQNNYSTPGAAGGRDQQSFQNTATVTGTSSWSIFNDSLAYAHANSSSVSGNSSQVSLGSDQLKGTLAVPIGNQYVAGIQSSLAFYQYGQPAAAAGQANSTGGVQWMGGAFGEAKLTDFISATLGGGFSDYMPDPVGAQTASGDDTGLYFAATLDHKINSWLICHLKAGQSTQATSYGQVQKLTYVQLGSDLSFIKNLTISPAAGYQTGTRLAGTIFGGLENETYTQINFTLMLNRQLTRHLSSSLSYEWTNQTAENSTLSNLTYSDNTIQLNLTYQF